MNFLNRCKKTPFQVLILLTGLSVSPLYYVTFTTAVLCASFILFQGFNTTDTINTVSLICGFLIIFSGVYLLNLSRGDPNGHKLLSNKEEDGVPTDGLAGGLIRRSMQARRSLDPRRLSNGSIGFSPRTPRGDREGLIHAYDVEHGGFGLSDLAEDSDGETDGLRHSNGNSLANGKVPPIKSPQ